MGRIRKSGGGCLDDTTLIVKCSAYTITSGAVLFGGVSDCVDQDFANFNWDTSLKQLNIQNHLSIDIFGASPPALASDEALRIWGGTGQTVKFVLDGATSNGGKISFRQSNTEKSYLHWDDSAFEFSLGTVSSYDTVFKYNNAEKARLSTAGLGIGMTPGVSLDVTSDSQTDFGVYTTGIRLRATSFSPITMLYIDGSTTNSFLSGIVLRGSTDGIYIGLDNNHSLKLSPLLTISESGMTGAKDNPTGMTIGQTGQVGIGVNTAFSTLDVGGGISLSTAYAGSVAAADGDLITVGKIGFKTATPTRSVTFNVADAAADYFCFSHNDAERFLLGYEQSFERFVMYNWNIGVYQTVWDSGGLAVRTDGTGATAGLHIYTYGASGGAAGTAPIKLTSFALMNTAEAGAIEFLTDDLYFTQTTTTNRHPVAWQDNPIPQQVFS